MYFCLRHMNNQPHCNLRDYMTCLNFVTLQRVYQIQGIPYSNLHRENLGISEQNKKHKGNLILCYFHNVKKIEQCIINPISLFASSFRGAFAMHITRIKFCTTGFVRQTHKCEW